MYKLLITTIYKTWVNVTTISFDTEMQASEAAGAIEKKGSRVGTNVSESFYREVVRLWF